jgi:hypothetical protein
VKPTAERASIGESTSTKSPSKRTAHSLFRFAKKVSCYQSGKMKFASLRPRRCKAISLGTEPLSMTPGEFGNGLRLTPKNRAKPIKFTNVKVE